MLPTLLFLIVLVGLGAFLWPKRSDLEEAAGQLPEAERRARELGLPLSARDMDPSPSVAEDANAAPLLISAGKMLQTYADRSQDFERLGKVVSNHDLGAAHSILERYQRVLDESVAAARRPRADFPVDWDLGPQISFLDLVDTKDAVKLLAMRARVRALEGDSRFAIEDLHAGHRLAEFVASEPFLISGLVAVAEEAILNAHEVRLAAEWHEDEEALAGLEGVLNGGWQPDLAHTMRGEVYLGVTAIRNLELFGGVKGLTEPEEDPPKVDPAKIAREGMGETIEQHAYMARHLQFWSDVWPDLERLRHDPWQAGKALAAVSDAYAKRKGASYALMGRSMPIFANSGQSFTMLLARRRTTLALVQALRERLRTGKYPSHTDLTDPFDDQPLRVKTDGRESFRVYSIGPNLKDDGGVDQQELPMFAKDFDYVAAYPPVKARTR